MIVSVMKMIKPILFNTQMVQAILDGRKTTTRRIVKGNINDLDLIGTGSSRCNDTFDTTLFGKLDKEKVWNSDVKERVKAPYMPGDILYVRETWFEGDILDSNEDIVERNIVLYRTDDLEKHDIEEIKWRPSIHMPKKLARIFLKVTGVTVEKLQDITIDGCLDEGVSKKIRTQMGYAVEESEESFNLIQAKDTFRKIWSSTLKKDQCEKYGWIANPYVWVISFERCEKPNE
ncbi:hypothetical protein AB2T90_13975 [Clostridium butyricum]|uniref:hypothetical protein n=1 Tax=Clostridium butyricum TaxID=1492 RepID=UPI0034656620